MNKAVFLDRDGTINVDKNYLYKIEDWQFIDGVIEGLQILQSLDYKLIVISNQSGIARGYYTKKDADKIFEYMTNELKKKGVIIAKSYYCPHIGDKCNCRKPKLGLFYQAQKEFDIDFSESFAIGDKLRDVLICNKEPVKGFLLDTNIDVDNKNIQKCKNLYEAVNLIKKDEQNG